MSIFSYFIWNVDPDFFIIPILDRPVRWYGLLFAMSFLITQQVMFYIYRKEGKHERDVESLTVYMIIATIIGARLGHVFFYEPEKYLANPLDILKVWEGGLASHGATIAILFALYIYTIYDIRIKFKWLIHGFIGIPVGMTRKRIKRPGQNYFQVVDRIVIVVGIAGCLIRLGNFMNSEIYGLPTNSDYGVIYAKNVEQVYLGNTTPIEALEIKKDDSRNESDEGYQPVTINLDFKYQPEIINQESLARYIEGRFREIASSYSYVAEHVMIPPGDMDYQLTEGQPGVFSASIAAYGITRHPTQIYESLTSLLLSVLLFIIWWRYKEKTPPGLLLGLFLVILFGLRFVHEIFKENQVAFEDGMAFNMGQILSIPLIVAGIIIFIRALQIGEPKDSAQD